MASLISNLNPLTTLINVTVSLLQVEDSHPAPFLGLLVCDNMGILASPPQLRPTELQGQWQIVSLAEFSEMSFSDSYDLAVLLLTQSPPKTAYDFTEHTVAIQRCRDLFARHSLIFAPSEQDFIAFGFSKLGEEKIALDEENSLTGWQFNLFDYKQLPDWFNSRFWANPENWNRFRW